jgi:predicted enzyme related to lactoylglutathione lyase
VLQVLGQRRTPNDHYFKLRMRPNEQPGRPMRLEADAPSDAGLRRLDAVILAGMEITGLSWCGTRTVRSSELVQFYEHVLGLRLVHTEPDLWVFELPAGQNVEVFGSSYPGREHFTTGPVVGFAVADLPAAVDELRRAGVELLGEPGPTWQHFRGPDGNVYELSGPEHNQ